MKFKYEGFTALGQAVSATVDAKDEGEAAAALRDQGIFANQLVPDSSPMKTILPGNRTPPTQKSESEMMYPWQEAKVELVPPPVPEPAINRPPPTHDYNLPDRPEVIQSRIDFKVDPREEATLAKKPKLVVLERWRDDLDSNLKAISEVVAQYDKAPYKFGAPAKKNAVDEMIKQALMRAVKDYLNTN